MSIDQEQADKMRAKMEKFFDSLTREEHLLLRNAADRERGRKESIHEMISRLQLKNKK